MTYRRAVNVDFFSLLVLLVLLAVLHIKLTAVEYFLWVRIVIHLLKRSSAGCLVDKVITFICLFNRKQNVLVRTLHQQVAVITICPLQTPTSWILFNLHLLMIESKGATKPRSLICIGDLIEIFIRLFSPFKVWNMYLHSSLTLDRLWYE